MEGVIIQKLKLSFLRVCLLNSILLSVYSCAEEQAVPVTVSFEVEVVNNDSTVPVQVNITNTTEGADTYNWTFIGGNPSQSTDRNPGTITYTEAGDYSIVLEASNQD
jgi:PKD repeat protein